MIIRLRLEAKALKMSGNLGHAVRHVLTALTMADRLIIRNQEVPPIYLSGVRYAEEPQTDFESFDDAMVCYKRGWGDCDDLASWRCAELVEQGEKATIRISWKPHPNRGGRLYHITVRRADGRIEDPSTILGMKGGTPMMSADGKPIPYKLGS